MKITKRLSRKETTLYAYWSKRERDILICYPKKTDGHLLHYYLGKNFYRELETRGYDIATFRFSIKKKRIE